MIYLSPYLYGKAGILTTPAVLNCITNEYVNIKS